MEGDLIHVARGLGGAAVLVALAWAFSSDRARVRWRTVAAGLALQVALAGLVFAVPAFEGLIGAVATGFVNVLDFSLVGAEFVFGPLADVEATGFVFCFQVLPTIVFFSALTSVLYHFGVLQRVVSGFAWVMSRTMGLSGAESLSAAANVFVGQTEAPLMVRPYIAGMSRSEVMALMTGGFATIAGGVMAAYVGFLGGDDPVERAAFARFLLCASLMNAPAALVMAKLLVPQVGEVERHAEVSGGDGHVNFLDALADGTTTGLKLALNVGAMLLVFLAFIAMLNWVLTEAVGGLRFGGDSLFAGGDGHLNQLVARLTGGAYEELSLEMLTGVVGAPFAWLIGVQPGDVLQVGQLLGTRIVANEFVAYADLASFGDEGALDPRSVFLATFALCGFANFGSIGIQLGGIGGMAPGQRPLIASLAVRALFAGTLASLLSASVAGMFYR